jgi:hypothetical protein
MSAQPVSGLAMVYLAVYQGAIAAAVLGIRAYLVLARCSSIPRTSCRVLADGGQTRHMTPHDDPVTTPVIEPGPGANMRHDASDINMSTNIGNIEIELRPITKLGNTSKLALPQTTKYEGYML